MEESTTDELFTNGLHPYTKGLLASLPRIGEKERLVPIPGNPPVITENPKGCPFYDRCNLRQDICKSKELPKKEVSPTHRVYCHMVEV